MPQVELFLSDCRAAMLFMPDNSIDAVVTDPPYGLSDHKPADVADCLSAWLAGEEYRPKKKGFMGKEWDAWVPGPEVWCEVFRVLKPGGHVIAFAGTRTHDLMSIALRLAGFECRDTVMWVYGSGFPKSKNLDGKWQGWGTALKPAYEPALLFRKPLGGTVAENVLAHGTGALNIDASRVPLTGEADSAAFENNHRVTERLPTSYDGQNLGLHDGGWKQRVGEAGIPPGRWPANLIHDGSDEVLAAFPEAPGQSGAVSGKEPSSKTRNVLGLYNERHESVPRGDAGSAARFFYCAKASKADRGEGNTHPTVKPTALAAYLIKLVTPPGGTTFDPYMGSGSHGVAAVREGFRFVGCDNDPASFKIAQGRIARERAQQDVTA